MKKALVETKTSDHCLRTMLDTIPTPAWSLRPDGGLDYLNQRWHEYSGLSPQEAYGSGGDGEPRRLASGTDLAQLVIVHPDDAPSVEAKWREILPVAKPREFECRLRRYDGTYRWFSVRAEPVLDERGNVVRWCGTHTDIEELKRAEDWPRQGQQEPRHITDARTEERVRNERLALREDIDRASMFEEIVGSSPALHRILEQVEKVAPSDSTVLILGETGTGKELVARAIHKRSRRSTRAFIRVNCAAIASSLIASELFGHEKGAFTGALQRRIGRFEAADGGTIFLDEVGELPAETQVALLGVLQEREVERVGSNHPIPVDVRVLAATNGDLEAAVERGTFRQDLYYRLNVFPIRIPPLRDRVDDIPVLVEYLVERYATKAGKSIRNIKKQTLALFQAHRWPGNVRELQNVIERAVVLCDSDTFSIDESWLKGEAQPPSKRMPRSLKTLAEGEKELIEAALAASQGRIFGPSGAAAKLGIPRQTLESKIKALHIDKLSFRARS
jgi:formate hydrogenlyase transcriptional activator